MTQHFIKAAFYRGGTSKGIFFHASDLPPERPEIERIILGAMGSPDPYGRQLDGMGGGISSLSKAVIIAPSSHPDADIDYTFIQVAVDQPVCEWNGVCGNLAAAVGPFAIEEGLVPVSGEECIVRIRQISTGKIIHSRCRLEDGKPAVKGDFTIAGIAGAGAAVQLDHLDPGGALTGKLLPTGNVVDRLALSDGSEIEVSIVDAANGCCFVRARDIGLTGTERPEEIEAIPGQMARLDEIRRKAGVVMGLAASNEAIGLLNPRIAIVSAPMEYESIGGASISGSTYTIGTRMVSMGRMHRAVPLASALCLGIACRIEGSIPYDEAKPAETTTIRIGNPSGVVPVEAEAGNEHGWTARRATCFLTARRLMHGAVAIPK